jgi:hypothetical protein
MVGCVHRHYDHDYDRGDRRPGAHRGHGPPPHAPAHGYRAKVRGYDLEFDARRGVYLVIGLPGVYWQGGWFFRLHRDRWVRAGDGQGPWHDARWGDVPIGLRGGKYHGPDKDRGKGKGKGKGKGRYDDDD